MERPWTDDDDIAALLLRFRRGDWREVEKVHRLDSPVYVLRPSLIFWSGSHTSMYSSIG